MRTFKKLYIDPEIQLPIIVVLILLVSIESIVFAFGFLQAIAITKQIHNPNQTLEFFILLICTIVPVVIVNFFLGTYLSHKIAGPMQKIRKAMTEITRGNLEGNIFLKEGDFLQSYALDFNRMIQTLKNHIQRDRMYVTEANELLNECQSLLSNGQGLSSKDCKHMQKIIKNAKSRLSIIDVHFTKRKEAKT